MLVGKAGTTTKTVEFDVSLSTSSRPPGPFPIASSPATAVPEPQLVRDGPLLAVRVDCESPLDRASNLATASAAEISPSIDCDRL